MQSIREVTYTTHVGRDISTLSTSILPVKDLDLLENGAAAVASDTSAIYPPASLPLFFNFPSDHVSCSNDVCVFAEDNDIIILDISGNGKRSLKAAGGVEILTAVDDGFLVCYLYGECDFYSYRGKKMWTYRTDRIPVLAERIGKFVWAVVERGRQGQILNLVKCGGIRLLEQQLTIPTVTAVRDCGGKLCLGTKEGILLYRIDAGEGNVKLVHESVFNSEVPAADFEIASGRSVIAYENGFIVYSGELPMLKYSLSKPADVIRVNNGFVAFGFEDGRLSVLKV